PGTGFAGTRRAPAPFRLPYARCRRPFVRLLVLCLAGSLLAGCGDSAADQEDRIEQAAETSAAAAGPEPVALGLSEAQLLEADLVGTDRVELGSVESVLRNAEGTVDRLLIEIEDSNPDRFVEVPIAGLTTVAAGDDTDLSTTMTMDQLTALP